MSRLVVPAAVLLVVTAALAPRLGRLSPADIVVVAALGFLAMELRRARLPRFVAVAGALWVVAQAVSAIAGLLAHASEQPTLLVFTVARSLEVLTALSLGAAAGAAGGGDAVRGSLFVASGAAGVYGLIEHLFPPLLIHGLSGERVVRSFERGTFVGEANHFGGLFAIVIAASLPHVAAGARGPLRRAAVFGAAASLAGLLTTGSRTGVVAAIAGTACAAVLSGRRSLLLLASGLAVAVAAAPTSMTRRIASLGRALGGVVDAPSALQSRASNWDTAIDGFLAHPLLGIGPGSRAMGFYDSELLLALEGGGLLGVLGWGAFVAALWIALRGRRHPGETGALVALIVLSIGTVSFHLLRTALPFAVLAGAALGATAGPESPGTDAAAAWRSGRGAARPVRPVGLSRDEDTLRFG